MDFEINTLFDSYLPDEGYDDKFLLKISPALLTTVLFNPIML